MTQPNPITQPRQNNLKERLDPLSDAVFSIILTLLVFEITVPVFDENHIPNTSELLEALIGLAPDFGVYFFSFAVLGVYWISHNITLGVFAKNFDRVLMLLNFLFLAIAGLLPVSAALLTQNTGSTTAIGVYSANILLMTLSLLAMRIYIQLSPRIQNPVRKDIGFSDIDRIYANARLSINIGSVLLAFIVSFFLTPLSYVLLTIPIIYGLIPGSLARTLAIFGIKPAK